MKKSLLISTLMFSSLLMGEGYDYEITPVIGYNFTQGDVGLKNSPLIGIEAKYNKFSHDIKPEVSVLYSKKVQSTILSPAAYTDVVRVALDGVYEFKKNHRNRMFKMYPFVKAGMGYEHLSSSFASGDSNFFLDGGAGVKFFISKSLAFKTEAVYMLKNNNSFGDRNLALLAGLSFSFGDGKATVPNSYVAGPRYVPAPTIPQPVIAQPQQPMYIANPRYVAPQPQPMYVANPQYVAPQYVAPEPMYIPNPSYRAAPPAPQYIAKPNPVPTQEYIAQPINPVPVVKVENLNDSDNDGVKNSKDKCPNSPKGIKVSKKGCPKKSGDDDKDGVKNSKDKCPNTPFGIDVNKKGCIKDKDDDKDGVENSKDRCPETPSGVDVNENGCIKVGDEDRDGVFDDKDICPTTPYGVEVNEEGCALTRTINIKFKYKSTDIATDSLVELQRFSDFLSKNKQYHVTIVGHTDNVGSAKYNVGLSRSRADSVRNALIQEGVLSSRLSARGDGEMYPLVDNTTAQGRAKNRRIEVVLEKVY